MQNTKINIASHKAKMQCEKQQDRAMHARHFKTFVKIACTVLVLLHKICCKNALLSHYHCVVNAALPQFLPCQFYYQFSTIMHSIKQSHNVIYLEATDLLVTRKPIPSFL